MIAEARALGLRGAHLMKDETLRERLAIPLRKELRVIAHNVWTSAGKFYQGDTLPDLPVDEVALLKAKGQAE